MRVYALSILFRKIRSMFFAADKQLSGHRVRQQLSFQKMMI